MRPMNIGQVNSDVERLGLLKSEVVSHWRKLEAAAIARDGAAILREGSASPHSCAFCREFMLELESDQQCRECPIFKVTGLQGCHGSPYAEADEQLGAIERGEFRGTHWVTVMRGFVEDLEI